MPKGYEDCRAQGGKMVTKSHGDSYTRLCKRPSGGWEKGETHKKKRPPYPSK